MPTRSARVFVAVVSCSLASDADLPDLGLRVGDWRTTGVLALVFAGLVRAHAGGL